MTKLLRCDADEVFMNVTGRTDLKVNGKSGENKGNFVYYQ